MLDNVKERLTKKLGPLPIWAWALIAVVVAYAAYRFTVGSRSVGAGDPLYDDEPGSIEDTDLDTTPNTSGSIGSGSGVGSGGNPAAIPTDQTPYDVTYPDYVGAGPYDSFYDPGYDPGIIDSTDDPVTLSRPTTTTAPAPKQSRNTMLVNERLALAEKAASEGNMAAAQNYARAALAFSRSETSTANINNILSAYGGTSTAAKAAAKPTPAKKATAAPVKKTAAKKTATKASNAVTKAAKKVVKKTVKGK